MQALQHAGAEEAVEEHPFAAAAELVLAQEQLLPHRHQHIGEHHMQGVTGEHLAVDALQPGFVQGIHCAAHLGTPLAPFPGHHLRVDRHQRHFGRIAACQEPAHLAHRDTALDPGQDAAHRLDIGQGIEPVAAVGAGRLDQTVTPLPGPQGDRVDPCQARDFTDGEELFPVQGAGSEGCTGFGHGGESSGEIFRQFKPCTGESNWLGAAAPPPQ
ncbi:hypothetical protein D9M71_525740 [compost metagenome]